MFCLLLSSCKGHNNENAIRFGVDITSPPYSFMENGVLNGANIELSREIGRVLNKEVIFYRTNWDQMFAALNHNKVDAIESSIIVTEARKKNADFSQPYRFDYIAVIFRKDSKVENKSDLENTKIAITLGDTSEIFAKNNLKNVKIVPTESNAISMELLKAKHVDSVITELPSAKLIVDNSLCCEYKIIDEMKDGCVIAVKKNSPILFEINRALDILIKDGTIKRLERKWLGELDLSKERMLG